MELNTIQDVRIFLEATIHCGYDIALNDMVAAVNSPPGFDYHVHKYWELKLSAPKSAGGKYFLHILAPGVTHWMTGRDIAMAISHHVIRISTGAARSIWELRFDEPVGQANLMPELLQAVVKYPPGPHFDPVRLDLMRAVLSNLLVILELGSASAEAAGSRKSMVETARDYMENYYYKADLSVVDIARFTGVSPQHLNAAFRAATGRTTRQTLIAIRLTHAQELLADSRYFIKDVAALTGWRSQFYFSNCYRRFFGCPPARHAEAAAVVAES